jgi:hypothetical protein
MTYINEAPLMLGEVVQYTIVKTQIYRDPHL